MKRTAQAPDLFTGQPTSTSEPKYVPVLPTTPAELAHTQAQLWDTLPNDVRGVIRGEKCVWLDACWQPIGKLTPAKLVEALSLS